MNNFINQIPATFCSYIILHQNLKMAMISYRTLYIRIEVFTNLQKFTYYSNKNKCTVDSTFHVIKIKQTYTSNKIRLTMESLKSK